MEQSRFISISNNPIENRRNFVFRRVLINRNVNMNYINNDNYISCNFSKTKIILLLIITIILSLSNYFYNWNNNISIIIDEPRTVLSLFDNNMFKINEQKKFITIRNLKEENDNIDNITSINNKTILDEFDVQSKLKSLKEQEIKKKIFNSLNKNYYKFNWTSFKINNISSLYHIGESTNGSGKLSIIKKTDTLITYIRITMKAYEQTFIDKWIIYASDSNLEELSINYKNFHNNNAILEIDGIFATALLKGAFFDILNEDEPQHCQTNYQFKFPYTYNKPTEENINQTLYLENVDNIGNIFINLNNFSMILTSSCGFNFEITANINNIIEEQKGRKNKINIYCIIASLGGILYSIGVYSIIHNIKLSENVISVINADCLLINPIFNTYISLSNINIAMRLNSNFYPFLTMIVFSIIKFIYFDFYLFALYWQKKRNYVHVGVYVKEKLRFYLIYYLVTFCCFLWVNMLFNYFFIMILCVALWVPHIIYNIKSNNRYGYPLIYVLGSTIDKLIYPIYFRGYKGNFIGCQVNEFLITLMVLFVIFTIIILYLQIFSNPRFMFSKLYRKTEFNFYKTKQELLSIKNDISSEECVICLSPIFDIEKESTENKMIEMQDKSEKKNSQQDEEKLDELDSSENNITLPSINNIEEENEEKDKIIIKINQEKNCDNSEIKNSKNIFKKIWNVIKILFTKNFFYFYKKSSTGLRGELYMYTPCNHVFHSECLEKWFEFKKECPNCRISMKEYLE